MTSHQTEIDEAVSAHAAEKAQAAFFGVVKRTDTEQLLFDAKSACQTLNQDDRLGRAAFNELFLAECLHLCGGDLLKAQLLASAVLA